MLAFPIVFTPYLSNAAAKSPLFFHALVALKLLVSLINRLVACSARIVVDKRTLTDTLTHICTQTKYCNPHAHTPRVNCIFPLTLGAVHLHPRFHSGGSDVWRYTNLCQRPAKEHSQTLPTKSRNPLDWI